MTMCRITGAAYARQVGVGSIHFGTAPREYTAWLRMTRADLAGGFYWRERFATAPALLRRLNAGGIELLWSRI